MGAKPAAKEPCHSHAGGRPQSAKGKSASKTAHELYLQTLQEARSALTQRPRAAPRQAARPQSAMSEPMQAISERLRDAQASAVQRKPAVPLPSPEERLKEEVTRIPIPHQPGIRAEHWIASFACTQSGCLVSCIPGANTCKMSQCSCMLQCS